MIEVLKAAIVPVIVFIFSIFIVVVYLIAELIK